MFSKSGPESEQKFILECIRCYRSLPCLWNMKIKDYHNREKKSKAYQVLVNKFRERYPNATREDVKKKVNSLRTCYRKQLRRYLQSVEANESPLYEPTLYYYQEMQFLQEQECAEGAGGVHAMDFECTTVATDFEDSDRYINESSTSSMNGSKHLFPNSGQKKKAVKLQKLEDLMDLACKHLQEKSDEYKHWAMACAADLKKMDPTQQIYAKKAISDILTTGQLGLLTRNSVTINQPTEHELEQAQVVYEDGIAVKYSSSPPPSYIDES